jgi:DNA-binding beta-propeller fold protein YncE/mono/diheme cytochrome c family protein
MRSPESDALYIVDEDRKAVHGLALPAELKSKTVDFQTPGAPAQVLPVGDKLLVTVRQVGQGEGALLILKRKGTDLVESGRVEVPLDAWGVTVTPDDKLALVTSAWTHKLTAVDLATSKVVWSLDVAREPRGIAVMPNGASGGYRAYVSHLIGSDVTRVDFTAAAGTITRVELPASPLLSPPNTKLSASLGYSVVVSPKGERVYFPRIALGAIGPSNWYGEGTVDVMSAGTESQRAPARSARPTAHFIDMVDKAMAEPNGRWFDGANPSISHFSLVDQPRAVVYRKKTDTILVASEGSARIVELDALAMAPTLVGAHSYGVSSAPAGIALSEDENEAYVYCRASNKLMIVQLSPDEGGYAVVPSLEVPLTPNEDDKLKEGRALFYSATDSIVSGGLACAGCHPEGRDDGVTWHEIAVQLDTKKFTNFVAGTDLSALHGRWGDFTVEGSGGTGYARQTPIIAGRVNAVGPYGWHGESATLEDRLIGGFGLHRWEEGSDNLGGKRAAANQLAQFIRLGLTPPPKVERALNDEEQKGKAIFESPATQCVTCHVPSSQYTDRNPVPLKAYKAPAGYAEDPNPLYKTPSLLYVGGSAPYMHDGRFNTLEGLFEANQDRMGKTAQLSADERKALIAFLRTL